MERLLSVWVSSEQIEYEWKALKQEFDHSIAVGNLIFDIVVIHQLQISYRDRIRSNFIHGNKLAIDHISTENLTKAVNKLVEILRKSLYNVVKVFWFVDGLIYGKLVREIHR